MNHDAPADVCPYCRRPMFVAYECAEYIDWCCYSCEREPRQWKPQPKETSDER